MKELSRQRKWQINKQVEGKCAICGKQRNLYATYCDDHAAKAQKRTLALQQKRQSEGLCRFCGKKRNLYAAFCDECQHTATNYLREWNKNQT